MVAVPALLADQLHVSAGSAERAGEASLEAALVAGSVIKLSSALATLSVSTSCSKWGKLQLFTVYNPLIP